MHGISTPYWDHITPAVHRVLGNLDRIPGSASEGSLSRDAWLYRFGGTFHPATRQCAFYPLAKLYAGESDDNPFRRNPPVLRYVAQMLSFTASLQNRDGSFSEWYPGQPSYCATAFLAAYLSETLLVLPGELDGALTRKVLATLDCAAGFLGCPRPMPPANQASAALLALHNAATLLGADRGKDALRMRDAFIASQPGGGWFLEDGGPDLGYQTLTLDMLTRCAGRGMDGLDAAIASGLSFLDRFVLPDGSAPACLSWRGTGFLLPFAIEWWAPTSGPARRLAARVRPAIRAGLLPTPSTVDDRYASHFFLPSFVDASFCARPDAPSGAVPLVPASPAGDSGGLRILEGDGLRAWIQSRRGTVVVYSDLLGSSAWEGPSYCLYAARKAYLPAACGAGRVEGGTRYAWESAFRRIRGGDASTRLGIAWASRVSSLFGRLDPGFPRRLESRIRRAAFGPGAEAPVRIRREVEVAAGRVRIRDVIEGGRNLPSSELFASRCAPPANQPSAGFFSARDLSADATVDDALRDAVAAEWSRSGRVEVESLVTAGALGVEVACRVNGTRIEGAGSGARVLR